MLQNPLHLMRISLLHALLGVALAVYPHSKVEHWLQQHHDSATACPAFKPLAYYTAISTGAEDVTMVAARQDEMHDEMAFAEIYIHAASLAPTMMIRTEKPGGSEYSAADTGKMLKAMAHCYKTAHAHGEKCNIDSIANPYASEFREAGSMTLAALSVIVRDPDEVRLFPYSILSVENAGGDTFLLKLQVPAHGDLGSLMKSPYKSHVDFHQDHPHYHTDVRPSSPDKPTTLARLAPGEKLAARNLVLEFYLVGALVIIFGG